LVVGKFSGVLVSPNQSLIQVEKQAFLIVVRALS
jgi:hypothetical protein